MKTMFLQRAGSANRALLRFLWIGGCGLGWVAFGNWTLEAAAQRVGTYDSRAIAYAHFQTPEHQKKIEALHTAAKKPGSEGKEQAQALKRMQQRAHAQVFGAAPAEEAMAAIKDRLPAIQRELQVDTVFSKWDKRALKTFSKAEKVDVTDRIVREFNPNEKQLKVIADLKTKKPVSRVSLKMMSLFE